MYQPIEKVFNKLQHLLKSQYQGDLVMTKAKIGIWTPWALILCYKCHGNQFPNKQLSDAEMERLDTPVALTKGYQITQCSKCNMFVQVNESVAMENNMTKELRGMGYDSVIEQTGGMNSACILYIMTDEVMDENTEYPPMYYLTYNINGDDKYWICGFDRDNEMIDDTEVCFDTYEEIMTHVQTLTNVKML